MVARRPLGTADRGREGRTRILLADDHLVVREALRLLIEGQGFEVVAEASDGREAIQQARRVKPDVAILDLAMPLVNGIEAAREIRSALPKTAAVLLMGTATRLTEYLVDAGLLKSDVDWKKAFTTDFVKDLNIMM